MSNKGRRDVPAAPDSLPHSSPVALAGRALGRVPPTAQVLAGIVSVQIGAAMAKQLFSTVGSTGTVALRLLFAAVVLLVVLMSLEPAVAALVGVVVLGEILGVTQWLTVLMVVAASVGATRTASPAH